MTDRTDAAPARIDPTLVGLADDLHTAVGFTRQAALAAANLSTADGSTVAFLGDLARELGQDLQLVVTALTDRLHAISDGRP